MPTDEAASDGALLQRELTEVRRELLIARDEVVGAHAELGQARGRIAELEDELARHRAAVREIRGFKGTPVWAGFVVYLRIRQRCGSIVRRILATLGR